MTRLGEETNTDDGDRLLCVGRGVYWQLDDGKDPEDRFPITQLVEWGTGRHKRRVMVHRPIVLRTVPGWHA